MTVTDVALLQTTTGEKIKKKTAPMLNSMAHTAKAVTSIPRPTHRESGTDVEKDQLREELFKIKRMNFALADQLQKGVTILHQELLSNPEKPNVEAVLMAMAGIKQAKDILSGDLPYDPRVLQINDTAFNFAASISESLLGLNFWA